MITHLESKSDTAQEHTGDHQVLLRECLSHTGKIQ